MYKTRLTKAKLLQIHQYLISAFRHSERSEAIFLFGTREYSVIELSVRVNFEAREISIENHYVYQGSRYNFLASAKLQPKSHSN